MLTKARVAHDKCTELDRPNLVIQPDCDTVVAVLPAHGLRLRWEIGPDDSVIGFAIVQQMESQNQAKFTICPITPRAIIDANETDEFEVIAD
jgi:hypothetical protein